MAYRYLILGSGMQGTAGGYDLAKWGDAEKVILADLNFKKSEMAASKINSLLSKNIAEPAEINIQNTTALVTLMKKVHGVFSATSYKHNLHITQIAMDAGIHMIDLGGNTDVVFSQLKLHEQALKKNISIIPDCGLAPGLSNILASCGIKQLDSCEEVQIRCGGLPQSPRPPLNYKLVFSMEGLTNEYTGLATVLRNGKIEHINTLAEPETLEFPVPMGTCEAFTTSGGTSTCPYTWQGKVKTFEYKTVRYPGHYEKIKTLYELGLLNLNPINVQGCPVIPREVIHTVLKPFIDFPEDKDWVVLRVTCHGLKDGKPKTIQLGLLDFFDEKTGFSAMERSTAFPAALVLIHSAQGKNKKGVVPLEQALNNSLFMQELSQHGLHVQMK